MKPGPYWGEFKLHGFTTLIMFAAIAISLPGYFARFRRTSMKLADRIGSYADRIEDEHRSACIVRD